MTGRELRLVVDSILDRADRLKRGERPDHYAALQAAAAAEFAARPAIDLSTTKGYCQLLAVTLLMSEEIGWASATCIGSSLRGGPLGGRARGCTVSRPASVLRHMGAWTQAQWESTVRSRAVFRALDGRSDTSGGWFYATGCGESAGGKVDSPKARFRLTEEGLGVAQVLTGHQVLMGVITPDQYRTAIETARAEWKAIPSIAFASGCASSIHDLRLDDD